MRWGLTPPPDMEPPTLQDVLAARTRVYAHMRPSPLLHHPLLDEWVGCRVLVKHENHNPTGAFKIRGGLNLVGQLSDQERQRGVIAASTGNHGQSLALACQLHGIRCRVVVPVGGNPDKIAAIRMFGAEILEQGRDFDEAREWVEDLAAREGWRYVHNANEPLLIAGVGTYAAEVFEVLEDVDFVFVPIGGGSGAAACGVVRDGLGRIPASSACKPGKPMRSRSHGGDLPASRMNAPTRLPRASRRGRPST